MDVVFSSLRLCLEQFLCLCDGDSVALRWARWKDDCESLEEIPKTSKVKFRVMSLVIGLAVMGLLYFSF